MKLLKQLFHHAGEIRTAQLNIKTCEQYNITNEKFKKEQEDIIARERFILCDHKHKYNDNIVMLRNVFKRRLSSIKDKCIVSYYGENIETLSRNFHPPIDPRSLHDSRKIIKNLLYPLAIMSSSLINKLNINKKYLDHLQDAIGDWHDADITLNLLVNTDAAAGEGYHSLNSHKHQLFITIQHLTSNFDADVKAMVRHAVS